MSTKSIATHRQRAALPTPGPQVQGGCVTARFLILDSLTDPRSLPSVLIGPLGERHSSASLNGSSRHVKELTLNFHHHARGFPHPFLLGGSSCRRDFMLFGTRAREWKKGVLQPSHVLRSQTRRLSFVTFLGHLDQQTQGSLPGRDPAWAANRYPFPP